MMSGNRDVHTCKDKTEVNPFRSKIVKLLLKFFWLKVKSSIVAFERHTKTLYLLFICFMRFLSASLTELIAFVCTVGNVSRFRGAFTSACRYLQLPGPAKEIPTRAQYLWASRRSELFSERLLEDNHWVEIIRLKHVRVKTLGGNAWLNFKEITWTVECNICTYFLKVWKT